MLLLACALAGAWSVPAFANGDVSYVTRTVGENGSITTSNATRSSYTTLTDNTISWPDSWYVVSNELTINSRVYVSGKVNLILCYEAALTVIGGINVSKDYSLTIYGQNNDTGKLTVSGVANQNAGIGAGIVGKQGQNSGTIVIIGGTVVAKGGQSAAGIGGGQKSLGVTVNITGGTVSADGRDSGAGIGGGQNGASGTITISSGDVTAKGGKWAAGIGSGYVGNSGDITISGGTVSATGGQYGAGIGGGRGVEGGTVNITGGTVSADGGKWAAGIGGGREGDDGKTTISGDTIVAAGGEYAAAIGGGRGGNGGTVIVSNGTITANGSTSGIGYGLSATNGGTLTLCVDETTKSITITATASKAANYFTGTTKISGDRSFYVVNDESTVLSGEIAEPRTTINGKTLKPFYVTTVVDGSDGSTVTCTPSSAKEGDTVTLTLSNPKDGYAVTFYVNNEEIDDNTFTMPSMDVVVSAETQLIEYSITYTLGGGSLAEGVSNPTAYTVESGDFTLTNPTRYGYTFKGWVLSGDEEETASTDLTIQTGTTGNKEYIATWERDTSVENIPDFAYNSLVLSGQIGMNFYVDMPDIEGLDYTKGEQCWMTFDISGKGTVSATEQVRDDTFTYTVGGKTYYGFRCYINSLQMADTITATLHYVINSQDYTTTQKISAKSYLDYGLAHESDEAAKKLLTAIKDYGHYAQILLKNEHNLTIGSGDDAYAEMDGVSTYSTDDYAKIISALESNDYAIKVTSNDSAISGVKYSLNLDSATAVNV